MKLKKKKKTKKGRKRKYVATILLGTGLAFSPLKASTELSDFNKMTYQTINLVDFNRGGFSVRLMNIETLGKQLSQEYKNYQNDFNSPRLSK